MNCCLNYSIEEARCQVPHKKRANTRAGDGAEVRPLYVRERVVGSSLMEIRQETGEPGSPLKLGA